MNYLKKVNFAWVNSLAFKSILSQRPTKLASSVLLLFSITCIPSLLPAAESLVKAGWIEEVRIFPGNLRMVAKLDTGAESASIHAENIDQFERDGKPWVKFTVIDRTNKNLVLEREVQRIVKIKRHKQKPAERPVVLLDICLGDTHKEAEVNLANRSNYDYELLIGRIFLNQHFTIDPSSKRTLEPNCKDSASE